MFAATPMYIIYYKEILILTTILTYSMYVYITKAFTHKRNDVHIL